MSRNYLIFIIIFIFFSASHLPAQDMVRVNEVIDTLCSPEMYGRGYTYHGDKIAANYIATQFKNAGLKSYTNDYSQPFQLNINIFPDDLALKIGKRTLIPGKEFIMDPSSGGFIGKGKIIPVDTLIFSDSNALKAFLKVDIKGQALVLDQKFEKFIYDLPRPGIAHLLQAGALLILTEKLTFGASRNQLQIAKFQVLKDCYPEKAKKAIFQVEAVLHKFYKTQNLVGYIPGTTKPDSIIIVCAHYDHLGTMGQNVYFPGANDNASGVAMLLEIAHKYGKNPLPYTLVFIAFGAEEAGLVGSHYFTQYPLFELSKTRFVVNLDLFGTGEEGMMVVNGKALTKEFEWIKQINEENKYLPAIKKRGQAANSDHYFFSQNGVPAFFFYLMGDWPNYHDINDVPNLPLTKFSGAYNLINDFIEKLSTNHVK
ncbi:M28 family metallopeptidase [Flexithrix dorotheae]|uniref:M28 family metallopeptidase n=1 Tax=Flexithrix dorotheae TaxID=70993 RepID=UPI00037E109F|nr:M28 family peptidase [Flexithrix dorotheae]